MPQPHFGAAGCRWRYGGRRGAISGAKSAVASPRLANALGGTDISAFCGLEAVWNILLSLLSAFATIGSGHSSGTRDSDRAEEITTGYGPERPDWNSLGLVRRSRGTLLKPAREYLFSYNCIVGFGTITQRAHCVVARRGTQAGLPSDAGRGELPTSSKLGLPSLHAV